MAANPWTGRTVGECLSDEFAGEWGGAPLGGGNAIVLRSTDIDDEGHVQLGGGARRRIPQSKLLSKKLNPGDILLESSGGGPGKPVGRVAFFPGGAGEAYLCSNFFRTLRTNPEVADPRFLCWRLQHFYAQPAIWMLQQQTTGIINLKYNDYLKVRFEVPPLSEQRQIAEILDTLDEAIRKTEQIIAKLQQVKQGLLHDLLTRGIDDNGELRDPDRHPEQFKDSPLGRIPKEWGVAPLAYLTRPDSPITYGVVKPGPHDDNGVPFVRGGDFSQGRILLDRLRTITRAVSEQYRRTKLEGGEVLVSLVGQPGACAVVPTQLAGANIARQTAMIRMGGRLRPEFLQLFISSSGGQKTLLGDTLGSVQQVINLRDLRKLVVPLATIDEQDELVARVGVVRQREDAELGSLCKLRLLKHGLMEDLLTGRVRVTKLLEQAAE